VPGSKRHREYASRAEPSSCLLPVLCNICAPITLPVCLSIVTNTTPFPVSPCFAHSARYSGFGVKIAFGGAQGARRTHRLSVWRTNRDQRDTKDNRESAHRQTHSISRRLVRPSFAIGQENTIMEFRQASPEGSGEQSEAHI
jgi:hypothetical protein